MNHATASRPLLVLTALALLAGCNQEVPIPKDPPEARKDYARTALDTPVTLAPLANDFDADDAVLTVAAIGQPAHGVAVLNPDGSVTYTPNAGFLGGDEFTVTVLDGHQNEVTESAYVTVGPSSRFLFVSNYVDFFTRQLYLSDSAHPGVPIPVSGRVPVTAGPDQPRQGIPPSGSSVQFVQSADGRGVLYWVDDSSTRSVFNLYYVDLDHPGVATKLTDIGDGQGVSLVVAPAITPDRQYAFYLSNEFNKDTFELVRVEIANPANKVRMNEAVTSHTNTTVTPPTTVWGSINQFKVSADGTTLLYVELDPNSQGAGVASRELHVMDVATPGVSSLISGTPTSGTLGSTLAVDFVPNTDLAVFIGTFGGKTTFDLYQVDYVAKTAPVQLSGTAVVAGVGSYRIAPDSSRIVYTSSEQTADVSELYTATFANPGVSTRVSKPRTDASSISSYLIGPDSSYVVYVRDDDTKDTLELYKTDFATPTVQTKLNHALRTAATGVTKESLTQVQVSAGAPRKVVYSTNDNFVLKKPTTQTARVVSVDAPGVATAVGGHTQVQYLVLWSPDGDNLTMFDDPENLSVISAFRAQISAPTSLVKLTIEKYPGALTEVSLTYPFLP